MSLVKGFTDILTPINLLSFNSYGGGGINYLYFHGTNNVNENNITISSLGYNSTKYINDELFLKPANCNATNIIVTRSNQYIDIQATLTGLSDNPPYLMLITPPEYHSILTIRCSMMNLSDSTSGKLLIQGGTSGTATWLYRDMKKLEINKWIDSSAILHYGTDMGDIAFGWRLNDDDVKPESGKVYNIHFRIAEMAVYQGKFVDAPFLEPMTRWPGFRFVRQDQSNIHPGGPGWTHLFPNNAIYAKLPQNDSNFPKYWHIGLSVVAGGSVMLFKGKLYLIGNQNYQSQGYIEWDVFFHAAINSSSNWILFEKSLTLVKSSNLNGAGGIDPSNVTLEYAAGSAKTGFTNRCDLYIKFNQKQTGVNNWLVLIPDVFTTTAANVSQPHIYTWQSTMPS